MHEPVYAQLPLLTTEPMKRCNQCHEVKPLHAFSPNTRTTDGRQGRCKVCLAANAKRYLRANPDHVHAVQKRSYLKHAEKRRAKAKAYFVEHVEIYRERARTWNANNPERAQKNRRQWIEENRSAINANRRAYWAQTIDRRHELQRASVKRHMIGYVMRAEKRRIRLNGVAISDLTSVQWHQVLLYFDHRCAYCGAGGRLTKDHVMPISAGGNHTVSNVVPACRSCNSRKKDRPMWVML